jgi:hypothetical protein
MVFKHAIDPALENSGTESWEKEWRSEIARIEADGEITSALWVKHTKELDPGWYVPVSKKCIPVLIWGVKDETYKFEVIQEANGSENANVFFRDISPVPNKTWEDIMNKEYGTETGCNGSVTIGGIYQENFYGQVFWLNASDTGPNIKQITANLDYDVTTIDTAKFTAYKITLSEPDPVKVGDEKEIAVTVIPAIDIWSYMTFDLENEKRHKCSHAGCTHGGEVADIAELTDTTVSSSDDKIKIKGNNNGHADLVVKVLGVEIRKSFRALTCICPYKPLGELWHLDHSSFRWPSSRWGDYGVLDDTNPENYNCIAYSMGINTKVIWPTPPVTFDNFKKLYRDNCGLHEYSIEKTGTTVYLYAEAGTPTHAAKIYSCPNCPCDAISKWGLHDTSFVCCHPKDIFGGIMYGTIARWYVPFAINFSPASVEKDKQITIIITTKCGTDAVKDVELEYTIADPTKLQFIEWVGTPGPKGKTDASGEAKIVLKGLAAGTSNLTISQTFGGEKTSGLTHAEVITITEP